MRKPAKIVGHRAGQHDVARDLALAGADDLRHLHELGVERAHARQRREIDDEEHDAGDQRDLGFDADAEPQDEQRRERELGRAVAADHERIEDRDHRSDAAAAGTAAAPPGRRRSARRRPLRRTCSWRGGSVRRSISVRDKARRRRPRRAQPILADHGAAELPEGEDDDARPAGGRARCASGWNAAGLLPETRRRSCVSRLNKASADDGSGAWHRPSTRASARALVRHYSLYGYLRATAAIAANRTAATRPRRPAGETLYLRGNLSVRLCENVENVRARSCPDRWCRPYRARVGGRSWLARRVVRADRKDRRRGRASEDGSHRRAHDGVLPALGYRGLGARCALSRRLSAGLCLAHVAHRL